MLITTNKILNTSISIISIVAILFSSFGISLYLHKCKTTGIKTVSILTVENCEQENIKLHQCCSNTENDSDSYKCTNTISSTLQAQIKKDCCSFDEENFTLSPGFLINKLQIHALDFVSKLKNSDIISNSVILDNLKSYQSNLERKILKPTKLLIKYILQLSSTLNSEDKDSNS